MPYVIVAVVIAYIVLRNVVRIREYRRANPGQPYRPSKVGLIWFAVCAIVLLFLYFSGPNK
jgi:hypothetical protein